MVDINKIKTESEELKTLVRQKTAEYILAAVGLVAGLAWNEAVKALIEQFIPIKDNTALAKLVYAVFVTVVFVLVSTYLIRLVRKDSEISQK